MQHKLYFAALLCGALCLTGCLKNEESPSVTQVRNAKANELESIATLNKANAEATLILANADAKIKEAQVILIQADAEYRRAEAKVKEAEVAIKEAEAAKLLAEAELKKVEADLMSVEIDIKKVELQQRQEELKALIAEYEARIAQAQADIAAAQAAKAYYEGQKQYVEAMLESALVEAQAALLNAKVDLIEAQKAYEDALKGVEAAAAEEAYEEVVALREAVEEASAAYHQAARELLVLQEEYIRAQNEIAKTEAGIQTAKELKAAEIEANNKWIARYEKVLAAIEDYQEMTPDEVLDILNDLMVEYIAEEKVCDEVANAYYAALEAYMNELPNATGLEADDPENPVTYQFTQDFFVPAADEPVVANLPMYPDYYWYHRNENGERTDAYLVTFVDPEDGLTKQVLREEVYGENGWETTNETLLYSFYAGNTGEWGVKEDYELYPELAEGIVYDARTPHATIETREHLPLVIDRAGYEAYVNWANDGLELDRDALIADYEDEIAEAQEEIDRRQAYVEKAQTIVEKMEKVLNETFQQTVTNFNEVWGLYDAYVAADKAYYETYIETGAVERTDAYWAYQEALQALDDAVNSEDPADIQYALAYKANLTTWIANLEEYMATYPNWVKFYEANIAEYKYQLEKANEALAAAQATAQTAQDAYDTQEGKVEAALMAAREAEAAMYEAKKAWIEAGKPAQTDATFIAWKNAAVTAFGEDIEYLEALEDWDYNTIGGKWGEYYTEVGNLAPLATALSDANKDLADAEDAQIVAQNNYDTYEANYNYAAILAGYKEDLAEVNTYLSEYNALVEAAQAKVDETIAAWNEAVGTDAAQGVKDAYDAYQTALDNVENPYADAIIKYGVITDPDDIDNADWSEIIDAINSAYDDADFYAWIYAIFGYDVTDMDYLAWWTEGLADGAANYYALTYYENFMDGIEDPFETQSALGVYYNAYYFNAQIATFQADIEEINAAIEQAYVDCEEAKAENQAILDKVDAVLANEAVYTAAIENLNNLYAKVNEAEKAWFDEYVKVYELEVKIDAAEYALYQAEELEMTIQALKDEIKALEEENADWEAIEDDELILSFAKQELELQASELKVKEALVKSLKDELDAALAALTALTATPAAE